jgi:DNA oxidative demethylase
MNDLITYKEKYVDKQLFDYLRRNVEWVNKDAPRDECFMSLKPLSYTYGNPQFNRTYNSISFDNVVTHIMDDLNRDYNSEYNVCFLNYYKSEKEHLGWHSDDSPEMDKTHPIAVISFGAERDIWVREKGHTGEIPKENKYNLSNGSLFIMGAGMQDLWQHKIPKGDRPLPGRISLTFRKYIDI